MSLATDGAAAAGNYSEWCGHRCAASGYMVFKPTSGLCNSLLAAASVAALAAASCRHVAFDWGMSSSLGAEAPFLSMFRPIPGVEFYTLGDLIRRAPSAHLARSAPANACLAGAPRAHHVSRPALRPRVAGSTARSTRTATWT